MKKQLALLLVFTLLFGLTACGENRNTAQEPTSAAPTHTSPTEPAPTEAPPTEPSREEIFKTFPGMFAQLGNFRSPEELDAYRILRWCMKNIKPTATDGMSDEETGAPKVIHRYAVAALDAQTRAYFGRTWTYSEIVKREETDDAQYHYDAGADAVVVTYPGAYGGPSEAGPEYTGYRAIDDTHFEIFYRKKYYEKTVDVTICAEYADGKYRITSQDMYGNIFKNYPKLVTVDEMNSLGFFDSVDALTASQAFRWGQAHIEPIASNQETRSYTYRVSDYHDFTTRYLGRMFDYADAQKDNGSEKIVYDEGAQTITVTYAGGMGGMSFTATYLDYRQVDDTHFTITYETNFDEYPTYDYSLKTVVMEVEKAEGDFVILSHKKA